MTAAFTSPRVLGTAEARKELPAILDRFRHDGLQAEPVFIGSYRHPEAVILSAEIVEQLAPWLEDMLLAERIRERIAVGGEQVSADAVKAQLGIGDDELATEKEALRRERGLR
jgi:hypothetical protein